MDWDHLTAERAEQTVAVARDGHAHGGWKQEAKGGHEREDHADMNFQTQNSCTIPERNVDIWRMSS